MNTIGIDSFSQETMSKIFTQIVEWHVNKGFPEAIILQGKVRTQNFKNLFIIITVRFRAL